MDNKQIFKRIVSLIHRMDIVEGKRTDKISENYLFDQFIIDLTDLGLDTIGVPQSKEDNNYSRDHYYDLIWHSNLNVDQIIEKTFELLKKDKKNKK
ncbi:MAG: hypothetical protein ACOCQR_01635 [bacterium]